MFYTSVLKLKWGIILVGEFYNYFKIYNTFFFWVCLLLSSTYPKTKEFSPIDLLVIFCSSTYFVGEFSSFRVSEVVNFKNI